MKDDSTLESLGIHSGSTVHALVRHKSKPSSMKGILCVFFSYLHVVQIMVGKGSLSFDQLHLGAEWS